MGYKNIESHQGMLKDRVRTEGYRDAIQKVVQQGQRVLDFGCGTGILSFFAERAGAESIYAVDKSKFIRVARSIARSNNFEKVVFFYGDHAEVELPEKVDVLVSEWMGYFIFQEWMLEPLISLRDKYLKKDGAMIPSHISMYVGFVESDQRWQELAFFKNQPYDIDFSIAEDWPYHQTEVRHFKAADLSGQVVSVGELDMAICEGNLSILAGEISAEKKFKLHGLCGWFDAKLAEDIVLRTGPEAPETHWKQLHFPLNRPMNIEAGDRVRVEIRPTEDPSGGQTLWKWSVSNGREFIEMDNSVHQAWVSRSLSKGRLS